MRTILYLNMNTGEITNSHKYAVTEFFNKGDDVEVQLLINKRIRNKTTWTHC